MNRKNRRAKKMTTNNAKGFKPETVKKIVKKTQLFRETLYGIPGKGRTDPACYLKRK